VFHSVHYNKFLHVEQCKQFRFFLKITQTHDGKYINKHTHVRLYKQTACVQGKSMCALNRATF